MKNFILIVVGIAIAGTIATYARYKSLNPCDWMEQDLAQRSNMPLIILQGQIRANFLLKGITTPGPYECVLEWWRLRGSGEIAINPPDDKRG